MAKPDKSARPIPFLKEGYALAQVLASDPEAAARMTVDAYAATAGTSRFALLEALLTDVQVPVPEPSPASSPQVRWETTSGFMTPSVSTGTAPTTAAPASLIATRLEAEERGREILGRFARLSTAARGVIYLGLVRGLGPADLASLFRVSPDQIGLFLEEASRSVFGSPARAEDPDLLGASLTPLLSKPDEAVKKAVRTAMTAKLRTPESRPTPRGRLLPVLGILAISVIAALAVTRLFPRSPSAPTVQPATNALEAAAAQLPAQSHEITSSDPAEIEAWMNQRIPWRFSIPTVEALPLAGAGFTRLVSGVRIPTLFYGSAETDLSIGVMNYAILQASSDRLVLDRPTIDRLASGESPELRTIDGHSVLAVRHRDDIYLAVSRQIDVSLPSRITFDSE